MRQALDVLCVGATHAEVRALEAELARSQACRAAGRPCRWGRIGELRVGVLVTGVGKANAALTLGEALGSVRPALVLAVGVGGAYPSSGLGVGEVAAATEEIYGDEGVETAEGFLGMEELALPLWEDAETRRFNRFPADARVVTALRGAGAGGVPLRTGPFVTLSTVTGTQTRAQELQRRFGGVCETMEGAAFAHAAAVHRLAFGEVRGVSNPVGPRERDAWQVEAAAAAAQDVVLRFLAQWCPEAAERRPGAED
ncbi:MAG: futalosine hydrolase [Deferrisomatales bacterium]|nr:futalosine hydrolase [Deferrisomatales bacterium]